MSKQSEFEQFVTQKVRPMYQVLEAGTGSQLTQSHALEAMAEMTANHLLGVCESWCNTDDSSVMSGPMTQGDYEARDLLAFLKQYINGKAEVEG